VLRRAYDLASLQLIPPLLERRASSRILEHTGEVL